MGRPVQKKWFGDPASIGYQLAITAKLPGEAVAEGYIIEQTGTREYKVNINGAIGDVRLVNETVGGNLSDGEGFITATPFGGSSQPVYKLTQYRVSLYDNPGYSSYVWDENDATEAGEATIDSLSADTSITYETATATATIATSPGPITGITVDNGGQGYLQVPTVTIDGDGSGATATATISDGAVTDITVDNGGADYTTATVTVESPEDANA
ncbi:MAG: hypothetical protein CMP47_12480 [Rickettsiales bacterium]|nr:hypothetical protein [Rickettsiales bacterium]|tara:strand:- start:2688 stop:3326 length:639 start_codon:yes stop_codon:yes gene_type:complete